MTYRIRRQDADGDMTFGQGAQNFLVDSPAAVAQRILTRLRLWEGEWFLDLTDGTPYHQSILEHRSIALAGELIRQRILGTPFVSAIDDFSVSFNPTTRALLITATVSTLFGRVKFSVPLTPQPANPVAFG